MYLRLSHILSSIYTGKAGIDIWPSPFEPAGCKCLMDLAGEHGVVHICSLTLVSWIQLLKGKVRRESQFFLKDSYDLFKSYHIRSMYCGRWHSARKGEVLHLVGSTVYSSTCGKCTGWNAWFGLVMWGRCPPHSMLSCMQDPKARNKWWAYGCLNVLFCAVRFLMCVAFVAFMYFTSASLLGWRRLAVWIDVPGVCDLYNKVLFVDSWYLFPSWASGVH